MQPEYTSLWTPLCCDFCAKCGFDSIGFKCGFDSIGDSKAKSQKTSFRTYMLSYALPNFALKHVAGT
jgi:hypothetical protein